MTLNDVPGRTHDLFQKQSFSINLGYDTVLCFYGGLCNHIFDTDDVLCTKADTGASCWEGDILCNDFEYVCTVGWAGHIWRFD